MYDMPGIQLEKMKIPLQAAKSYTFEFGPTELANMCAIPKEHLSRVLSEFLREPVIRIVDDRITVTDLVELSKQSAYRKKILEIERSRNEGRTATNSTVLR